MGCRQQHNAGGVVQCQLDAAGNQVLDASRNPIPEMEDYVQEVGNLFNIWHILDRPEVLESCRIYYQHAKDVDQQNLTWSHELLLKNVDSTLQQHILSACENLPEYVLSGPFAFVVMAEHSMSMTQNLAHNINSGLLIMSPRNFEGEDVIQCVFILRNVFRFLNYGIPGFDQMLPFLMDNLFDVFMSVMNTQFRNYIQNLKDLHYHVVNNPEALFVRVQNCNNNVITKPGAVWLKTKKSKAAFTAGTPSQCQPVGTTPQQVTQMAPAPAPTNQGTQPGGGNCQPRQVDCTKPKEGEPHTCVNEHGREEHWCSWCPKGGQWGNHLTNGHN